MNGGSLLSYALYDAEGEHKAARDAQREALLKNNTVVTTDPPNNEDDDEEIDDKTDDNKDDDKLDEAKDGEVKPPENETEEQKVARETIEKEEARVKKEQAKAKRKDERVQKRIDDAIAAKNIAEEELRKFKEANPDTKLTEEEVEARATALADKKLREKQIADLQKEFEATCDKIQRAANKLDTKFDDKVEDIVHQFGPIPSFMIGTLDEFENGPDVLVHIINDDDLAEKLFGLQNRPAKLARELVELSNKLEAEKKKKNTKQISKVNASITPVHSSNTDSSSMITEADAKNMDVYTRKRMAQIEERRKAGR